MKLPSTLRRAVGLVVAAIASLGLLHCAAHAAVTEHIKPGDVWRYVDATDATMMPPATTANFFAPDYNDSGWFGGAAPFGNVSDGNPFSYNTFWDILKPCKLRKKIILDRPRDMHVEAGVDNGFNMYINGQSVQNVLDSGYTYRWEYNFDIPASYFHAGENVIAISLSDDGGLTAFDMRMTSTCIPDLVPTELTWVSNPDTARFRYRIDVENLKDDAFAKFYWARETTSGFELIQPTLFTTLLERSTGSYGPIDVHLGSAQLPDGATYLVVILDADDQVCEVNEDNNLKSLSIGLPDIEAVKLELSLDYANAVITYRIREKAVSPDTQFGLYWARGPSASDIIGPAMPPETLPRIEVGTWQIYRSALALQPKPDATTHLLLVVDPPLPGGAVMESSELNNIYPFPVVPISPTVQIVVARLPLTATASGGTVVTDGDPIWKREPYKAWLQVSNNWNQGITVAGNWKEILPTRLLPESQKKSGNFDAEPISAGELKLIPLNDATSGPVFQHTWDWIPASEPVSYPKFVFDLLLDQVKTLFFKLPAELLEGPFPVAAAIAHLADKIDETLDSAQGLFTLLHITTQATLTYEANVEWWPSSSGPSAEKTILLNRSILIKVRSEHKRDYLKALFYDAVEQYYADNSIIDEIMNPAFYLETAYELQKIADSQYRLAVDPPETNFTQIALPQTNRPPGVTTIPDGAAKQLVSAVLDMGAVAAAEEVALNRAQGAEAAEVYEWQARQLIAAADYASARVSLQTYVLLLNKQIEPQTQESIASNRQLLVPSLEQNGLPRELATNLVQLGWTATQIEAYRQSLIELGTSLLDEPGLSQTAYTLGVYMAAADASQHLSDAITIRRDKLGVVASEVTTAQRQQLTSGQMQLEAVLAGGVALDAVLPVLDAYMTNLFQTIEESANPESLQSESAFGELALGSLLRQIADPAAGATLGLQYTTNQVVLSWPALSSLAIETSSNLSAPRWFTVQSTPTNDSGQYILRVSPTNEAAFFRLRNGNPIPSISANLEGTNVADSYLVSDPHITGMIADGAGVSNLFGGFVTDAGVNFTDLSAGLSAYFRRFSLDRTQLEQIYGGPLPDGSHTFRLSTFDAQSNVVSSVDYTFVLDTRPPTVYLTTSASDVDTNRAGLQVYEGARIPVRSGVFDEVQVKSLELLSNGQVIATGSVFPWEDFVVKAPPFILDSNTITLQARGTDSAGNVGLSTPLVLEVVPDMVPPAVTSIDPPDGATVTSNLTQVTIRLSEQLDPGTVNLTNIVVVWAGSGGVFDDGNDVVVTNTSLTVGEDEPVIQLGFEPLGFGVHEVRISGNSVKDLAGNTLTNDFTSRFHVFGRTTIVGIVQRANGTPVVAATVSVAGQNQNGVTGSDGRFSLAAVPIWLPIDAVTVQTRSDVPLFGFVRSLALVEGGVADLGIITVRSLCETYPANCVDSDGDGIPDSLEGLGLSDGTADFDGDGLSNFAEIMLGSDPKLADADRDGLSDYEEIFVYGTNPNNPDTDGDGWPDGLEVLYGTNPTNASSHPARRVTVASSSATLFNIAGEAPPNARIAVSQITTFWSQPEGSATNQFLAAPILTDKNR